jgi:hypothetical protein
VAIRSSRGGNSNPEPIAIWIDKVDFPTPWLFQDIDSELMGNPVEVIDPQVDQVVGTGVAGVLRKEEARRTTSSDRGEHRQARFKDVFPFLLVSKSGIPSHGVAGV